MSSEQHPTSNDADPEQSMSTPTQLIFESELWTERPKDK